MSEEKKDGGPIYPVTIEKFEGPIRMLERTYGLTKREWFAGIALQGMIAGSQGLRITVKEFAEQSFKLADAMLRQGEK